MLAASDHFRGIAQRPCCMSRGRVIEAFVMPQLSMHSPVGDITISEDDGAIVAVDWGWGRDQTPTPLLKRAVKQLNSYFDGKRKKFELPLKPAGSDFQKAVWREMAR